jgi:hypothetical protein
MRLEFHPSYGPALLVGVFLQVSWLGFLYFCTYHIFPFALIPAAAYCVITPIIIVRHPQPTGVDLQMVRSGYFFYCALALLAASVYATFLR